MNNLEKIYNHFSEYEHIDILKEILSNSDKTKNPFLIDVFDTLQNLKMDNSSIISAFMYILGESNPIFGEECLNLLKSLNTVSVADNNYKNTGMTIDEVRSMLFAMAKDIRVLIILLSVVLYRMKNLNDIQNIKDRNIFVHAVNDIYTPLSGRLGLNDIKNTLENLCFMYLEPKMYDKLLNEEVLNKEVRQKVVDNTIKSIVDLLDESKIVATVVGRQKHLASIFKKMKSKQVNLAQIYDLVAVRVIVSSVEECYTVLGKVNNSFSVLPERFKDYIAVPKPNGYQSLHTCIIGENNRPIEVQIRTIEMHRYNEYGVAAHWIYKEKKKKSNAIDTKMNWFREMIEENSHLGSKEFVDNIKTDLFASEIFVQTPTGKIIQFPLGSTCIDFAYAIHSDVGNKCVGAKINGKIKPIASKLSNGDICEIITSGSSKGPSRDWLKIVKTSSARSKIGSYFRKEFVEENIKQGKIIFEKLAKDISRDIPPINDEKIKNLCNRFSVNNIEELYAAIGHGSVTQERLLNNLLEKKQNKKLVTNLPEKRSGGGILIDNQPDMLTRFAKCCTPLPGDKIVGFVSRGRGVTIHRADCKNIKYLEDDRLISAEWIAKNNETYRGKIRVLFNDNRQAITSLSQIIDKSNIKLLALESRLLNSGKFEVEIEINILNNKDLMSLIEKISKIPGVITANRLT